MFISDAVLGSRVVFSDDLPHTSAPVYQIVESHPDGTHTLHSTDRARLSRTWGARYCVPLRALVPVYGPIRPCGCCF